MLGLGNPHEGAIFRFRCFRSLRAVAAEITPQYLLVIKAGQKKLENLFSKSKFSNYRRKVE